MSGGSQRENLCVPWERGEGGGGRMQYVVCDKAGDEIWRRGRRGEDLQLDSLLPWLDCNLLSFNEFLI